jgi:hypothetical protein
VIPTPEAEAARKKKAGRPKGSKKKTVTLEEFKARMDVVGR